MTRMLAAAAAVILAVGLAAAPRAEEIAKPPQAEMSKDEQAVARAIRNLGDPEVEVRENACLFFIGAPDARALEPLMRHVFPEAESSARVRYHAVRAVGELRRKEAFEPLVRVAESDPAQNVRWVAVVAIGQSGDPRAVDLLKRWLEVTEPDYRPLAALALGYTKDRRALGLLTQAMASTDKGVRRDAARGLANFGDAEGCAIILGRIEMETSGEAMRAMLKALQDLKCKDAPAVFARLKKKLDTSKGEFLHMNTLMDDATFVITGKRPE